MKSTSAHKVEQAISIDLDDAGSGGEDGQKDVNNGGTDESQST